MLPEGYEPSKPVVIVSTIILVAFAIYSSFTYVKRKNAFDGEVRYTVGTTMKRYLIASGYDIDYEYFVQGKKYVSSAGHAYNSIVPDGRYWVKFSIEYPDVCEIYQNMPVDARIDSIPPNGFKGRYNYNQFQQWLKWAEQQGKE